MLLQIWLLLAYVAVTALAGRVARHGGALRLRLAVEHIDHPGTPEPRVIDRLGPPSSMTLAADGAIRFEWSEAPLSGGYHVAMMFRDGVLLGVSHENYQEVDWCR